MGIAMEMMLLQRSIGVISEATSVLCLYCTGTVGTFGSKDALVGIMGAPNRAQSHAIAACQVSDRLLQRSQCVAHALCGFWLGPTWAAHSEA